MKEPEIVVLSGENRLDDYKNFFFKDKEGWEYKIGGKRKDKDQIAALIAANSGKGVKLIWAVYTKGTDSFDFIKNIELVEEGLPEPVPVSSAGGGEKYSDHMNDARAHEDEARIAKQGVVKTREDGMREGMWWNNMGNRIGDGSIERDFPTSHVYIKTQYYREMSDVTGVDFRVKKEA